MIKPPFKFIHKKSFWITCILGISLVYAGYFLIQNALPPISPKPRPLAYLEASTKEKIGVVHVLKDAAIDDASGLNRTPISGVVHVVSEDSVKEALAFARQHHLKVSIAGKRHTMGGQTFAKNCLVLDMTAYNRIQINKDNMRMTVQSGATWTDILSTLNREGLSVKAMQSISIFSVGGTLSVNAHGIAHNPGQISSTVRSMKVMLADGRIVQVSSTQNPELFSLIMGGYGLFGVILEVELDVVKNEFLHQETTYMTYTKVPQFYNDHIKNDPNIHLFYGRLSVSPESFLTEVALHCYRLSPVPVDTLPLQPEKKVWLKRLVFNLSKTGAFGRWLRWQLEKHVEPFVYKNKYKNHPFLETRNQIMCGGMSFLENRRHDTDILQEYFIKPEHMAAFLEGLKRIVIRNKVNLLNAGLRRVSPDHLTVLSYAPDDRLAFVLYFNQKFTPEDRQRLENVTQELIDLAISLDGTFYLPYQLYYSPIQLKRAYPNIDYFFASKRKYDPNELFTNKFYEKYGNRNLSK